MNNYIEFQPNSGRLETSMAASSSQVIPKVFHPFLVFVDSGYYQA